MDEPSVQLQLDLKHAVQNELATCRPLLHRLHHSTYLVQVPRPAHAVKHGSRFYYNVLVDGGLPTPESKSRDWFSSSNHARQTESGSISVAEELLREIELLASCTGSEDGSKSYDLIEDELSRLETLVDVAVVRSDSLLDEAFLRQIHANVPVFALQTALSQFLELQHFRTVVPLPTFGAHGYKDWRDTTLPPLPEWVGLSVMPRVEDEPGAISTLLVTFNNHHHNGNGASKNAKSMGTSNARQKRHAVIDTSEESAEAIFFSEDGLADNDLRLLSSANPPIHPLAVSQGPKNLTGSLDVDRDEKHDLDHETPFAYMYSSKYHFFELNNVPDKGQGFLAWLIAKARLPFGGGSQDRQGEPNALTSHVMSKGQDSEQVELVNGQSKMLI